MNKLTIKKIIEQRGTTSFLKFSIIAGALFVTFIVGLISYGIYQWTGEFTEILTLRYPVLFGLALMLLTFYGGCIEAFRILSYIERDVAFSDKSIRSLTKIIKYSIFLGLLFVAEMPIIYLLAELDDAPGLILFGLIFTFIPFAIAVFAALAQKLLQNAIDFKSENELTV